MKKVITTTILSIAVIFNAYTQNIEGDYCELVQVSALGKNAFVVYHNDKMEALVNDKGEKVTGKNITTALNILSARGFDVVTTYISDKGGNILTYLLRRRKT
jgi:hypothetical protein